jgi:hypothetical protein
MLPLFSTLRQGGFCQTSGKKWQSATRPTDRVSAKAHFFAFKFNSLSLEKRCPYKHPRSLALDFRGAVAKIPWPNWTPQRAILYTHHTGHITELPGCYDEATLEV